MEPFKYRIFVCTADKDEGKSSCVRRGSKETLAVLKEELVRRNLQFDMKAVPCGCFDLCERGPNLAVYPEGIWYSGLSKDKVADFVETQLVKGKRFEPCACDEDELKNFFEKRKIRKMAETRQR
ncbi:MAG: (2Fe-2S) ferredoxin domain-containing protein [Deltaproteobacteria bacterium]|nr:(2Fe-2S) ferredoxin domain-containing protein [Deltaproteobacteria bacterium]